MTRKEPYTKKVPRIVVHFDFGGGPFCSITNRFHAPALTLDESEVTCKRCLAFIGCQDASHPKNSSLS